MVGVTSARRDEGKSTTAANLAMWMAEAGMRVLLVGADLRKPALHKAFGVANTAGLTTLLSGESILENTIVPVAVEGSPATVWLLPAGPHVPNPAEMLGSRRMQDLLEDCSRMCDVMVLDLRPVLAVSDTCVVATKVDGVLLASRTTSTRRDEVQRSAAAVHRVGGRILGCVLNAVHHSTSRSAYYGYDFEY